MKRNRKYSILLLAFCSILALIPQSAGALEELCDSEMHDITGQAGVSILVNTVIVTNTNSTYRLEDNNGGSIAFDDNELLLKFRLNEPLMLDIYTMDDFLHPLHGTTIMKFSMTDAFMDLNTTTDSLKFNGVNLGQTAMTSFNLSKAEMEIFPYDGAGFDAAIKAQFTTDQWDYTYDTENKIDPKGRLQISSILVANSFGGDPLPSYEATVNPGDPINTGTWTPIDYFEIGDMDAASFRSFSLDLETDTEPYVRQRFNIDWQGNYNLDPDGRLGDGSAENPYVDNARQNHVYIKAGIPVEGSVRFETVVREFGGGPPTNYDLGPAAIDNMKGYSVIEAPGYGIGNSPILPSKN